MLYFGFLLVAFAIGIAVYEKTENMKKRVAEYSSLLALFVYLKSVAIGERKTPAEAFGSFSEKAEANNIPWIFELTDGGRVNSFLRERGILSLPSLMDTGDRNDVAAAFFELGTATAEEESARLSRFISEFEKRVGNIKSDTEKNTKAAWVLFASALLGALILIA